MISKVEYLDHVEEYNLEPGVVIKTFHVDSSTWVITKDMACLICLKNFKLRLICSHHFNKDCAMDRPQHVQFVGNVRFRVVQWKIRYNMSKSQFYFINKLFVNHPNL